nr:hypothetical protein Iba_chr15aCG2650 [Ipomoea batatas]
MVYCITSTRKLSGKLQSLTMITISRLKLILTSRLKAAHFAHSNSTPQQQSLFILPFFCKKPLQMYFLQKKKPPEVT